MDRRRLIGGVWQCLRHEEGPTAYVIVEYMLPSGAGRPKTGYYYYYYNNVHIQQCIPRTCQMRDITSHSSYDTSSMNH